MKNKRKKHGWEMTLEEYENQPMEIPDTASGHYADCARLLRKFEWTTIVCDALIANKPVPVEVVRDYMHDTVGGMPPHREKEYMKALKEKPKRFRVELYQPNQTIPVPYAVIGHFRSREVALARVLDHAQTFFIQSQTVKLVDTETGKVETAYSPPARNPSELSRLEIIGLLKAKVGSRRYTLGKRDDDKLRFEGDPICCGSRWAILMNGEPIGWLFKSTAYPGKYTNCLSKLRFDGLRPDDCFDHNWHDSPPFDAPQTAFEDAVRRAQIIYKWRAENKLPDANLPLKRYRVYLNQWVSKTPGHHPHTVIGEGVYVFKANAESAIHEVSDEYGINPEILSACLAPSKPRQRL